MLGTKEVLNRIQAVSATQQITKAMKMVAAAKLNKAQQQVEHISIYIDSLAIILRRVQSICGNYIIRSSCYTQSRPLERLLLIPIASDRGLCGSFNTKIKKATQHYIADLKENQVSITLVPIGQKALNQALRLDYTLCRDYVSLAHRSSVNEIQQLSGWITTSFEQKAYDSVILIYNDFKNAATQVIETEQILPLQEKYLNISEDHAIVDDCLHEPVSEKLLSISIQQWIQARVYRAIYVSRASEHGARMTAMSKATDNTNELIRELRLAYNRARQASITNEILEIMAGVEALSL